MTKEQWDSFDSFRVRFAESCAEWAKEAGCANGWLAQLQKEAADADGNPAYSLETPVVFNQALGDVTGADDIRLIIVGDNPGKDEQLSRNRRYLVGQAGKLGDGFFRKHPELGIDFRRNVVILNKTPIHTAKTKQLSYILKHGGPRFAALFSASQEWMARETAALRRALGCGLWLVGYGELRQKGLFAAYAAALTRAERAGHDESAGHADSPGARARPARDTDAVRLYQHFSMNRFSIDLAARSDPALGLAENLRRIGVAHRREILGW